MPQADSTLYLIDGHAQMFRAYFAIRGGMSSPVTGEPTNACFAFAGMLIKLFEEFQPRYAAMAIDSEAQTFRDELYPEYKSNREEAPEDFRAQIPRMLEIARGFGIPVLEVPGAEADDIMATLADRLTADHPGLHVRLVSKDKDLEQVIADHVTLFDIHTDTELDADALLEKKGITPAQAIDFQTLIGDSTDNIPGVKGIGPKTAATLIGRFGGVDELVAHVDELKGKQKENLRAAIDTGQLELSRQLVTLKRDVVIDFDLDAAQAGPERIDAPAMIRLFKDLGFNRHLADLQKLTGVADAPTKKKVKPEAGAGGLFDAPTDDEAQTAAPEAAGDYHAITTRTQLDALVKTLRKQKLLAVDTETIGLGADTQLCGVCLAWEAGAGVYLPTRCPDEIELDEAAVLDALRPVLEDEAVVKVAHNLKYDFRVLRNAGVALRGPMFDTMIAAFLAGRPGRGLDHLALSEFGHEMIPITSLIGPKPTRKADPPQKTMDQVPLDRIAPYAAEDADFTLQLYERLKPELDAMGMGHLADDVEMPLVVVLADMEDAGIKADPAVLDEQREALQARIDELRQQILNAAQVDFNPDSPKQLGDVLFNQLHFPVIKRTKTGYSTDVEVLEKLADRDDLDAVPEHARTIPSLVLEHRMLTKLVGTYLVSLKESIADDGRIHTSFVQTGAATGRLASNNPNLQNIPIRTEVGRQVRRAFVAEPGHTLIAADYSQIELRMLAHLAEDENLLAAFNEGLDIHTAVAAQVFGLDPENVTPDQRGHAKMINFGIIYGITPYGLARRVESLDNESAAALINDYKKRFAGIDRFMDQCVEHAKKHGYVTTMLGRRRAIPEVHSRNGQQRQLGERLAINSVVQGSAADLIKTAMVELHRRIAERGLPMRMLLQIHDELVVEAPAPEAAAMGETVREVMEGAMSLKAPLKVDVGLGASWFDAK